MFPELSFTVSQREGTRAVVRVVGAMDYDTSAPLEAALLALVEGGAHHLVLDMADLGFCDSSGINTLIRVLSRAKQKRGSVALAATTSQVQDVLRIVGVDTVITGYPTVALALDSIPPDPPTEQNR